MVVVFIKGNIYIALDLSVIETANEEHCLNPRDVKVLYREM